MKNKNKIWHIHEDYAADIKDIITECHDMEKPQNASWYEKAATLNVVGSAGVIPIQGPLFNRDSAYSRYFGQSYQNLNNLLDQAMSNKKVNRIILDIDSPGGDAMGMDEMSGKIASMRSHKPIIAMVNGWMASAAYGIGSAASEIVAMPTSQSGSIGTLVIHQDVSKALDKMGIKLTIVKAGEHKVEGNPYEPLNKDAKEYLQYQVNQYYDRFVNTVASNRNTTADNVKATYGKGRMLIASDALQAGMIDRIATFEQIMRGSPVNKQAMRNRLRLARTAS